MKDKNFKRFNSNFSLYDGVKHKYVFSVFSIIGDDIYIPATVGVESIQSFFPEEEVSYNKITPKAEKIEYTMLHVPRNELQEKAIKFLTQITGKKSEKNLFLSLGTGEGKTYITINTISQIKKRPLIIVDTLELATQWKNEFLKHTNLTDSDIVVLSGQKTVNKEKANPTAKIYIGMHQTLGSMLTDDANSVNDLMKKLKIGVRVFDESHVEFGNICRINSLSNVQYTIYLTATPSRSNFNDNSLYGKVFKKIPYFNGKELSQANYHTVILYPMNTKPPLDVKLTIKTKYGFSINKWAAYVSSQAYEALLETVEEIFSKFSLLERKKKTAIILPTNDLVKKLKADLEFNHPGVSISAYIGEIKPEDRQEQLKKDILITNDKMFDKAIDVPDLECLINFVQLGSLVKTEQIIGRLRYKEGKSSILFDITDYGFDETIKQLKIRKRFYKKKAKKIIEIKKEN